MNNKRNDLITGIVLALFALWYFYEALSIRVFAGMGKAVVNSTTMPKIWAVCLLLLAGALILRSLRTPAPKGAKSGSFSLGAWVKANYEVFLTFTALFIYAALMEPLGFIISSILYIFAQTLILMDKEHRSYVKALAIAVVCSVASYAVFVYWLAVLLPVGAIFE